MGLLYLENLPTRITKGTLLKVLVNTGGIASAQVGVIELRGQRATIEVPDDWTERLARKLNGAQVLEHAIRAWVRAESYDGPGAVVATADSRTVSPARSPGSGSNLPGRHVAPLDRRHFSRLMHLLDLEAREEALQIQARNQRLSAREAEQSGNSLCGLTVRDEASALGGRVLLTLGKRDLQQPLPWTRLTVGTPVLMTEQQTGVAALTSGYRGIVCARDDSTVEVAFDRLPDLEWERVVYRIDLASDEVSRQRQQAALEQMQAIASGRIAELRAVWLGETRPEFALEQEVTSLDDGLNPSQQRAVRFALSSKDLAVIHGPPGTGKTTTLVELIRQAVLRGEKVLACAPSNLAVDNLLEKLLAAGERAVRLGHPARVLPELQSHTLDLLVDSHPDVRLARRLVREARALREKASKYTRAKPLPGAKQEMRQEARELMDDARRLESQVVRQILDSATVLCATLTGLDGELLGSRRFDLVVIDEAGQSTEPACCIPALYADRIVLAGDHCQLPPTVLSAEAARGGLSLSLLERMVQLYGTEISRRLTVQYRMHTAIMNFSSAEFYDAELVADASVAEHTLADLAEVIETELTLFPIQFIDTAGAGYEEELEPDGDSRRNPQEANLVEKKVQALLDAGVPATDIAVITPYAAQVRLLRSQLRARGIFRLDGVEVDTVDGFQGREKEAVIISLVRSNGASEIGFLADVRRMNVALTRARRKLIVIGDSATVGGHPFYQRLLEYFERAGAYGTVWQEE